MNIDDKLDPEGELLPLDRYIEIHIAAARQLNRLKDQVEQRELNSVKLSTPQSHPPTLTHGDEDVEALNSGPSGEQLRVRIEHDVNMAAIISSAYQKDNTCSKVLSNPKAHLHLGIKDKLIWTKCEGNTDDEATTKRQARKLELIKE
jgi:hypothetical protein